MLMGRRDQRCTTRPALVFMILAVVMFEITVQYLHLWPRRLLFVKSPSSAHPVNNSAVSAGQKSSIHIQLKTLSHFRFVKRSVGCLPPRNDVSNAHPHHFPIIGRKAVQL